MAETLFKMEKQTSWTMRLQDPCITDGESVDFCRTQLGSLPKPVENQSLPSEMFPNKRSSDESFFRFVLFLLCYIATFNWS